MRGRTKPGCEACPEPPSVSRIGKGRGRMGFYTSACPAKSMVEAWLSDLCWVAMLINCDRS